MKTKTILIVLSCIFFLSGCSTISFQKSAPADKDGTLKSSQVLRFSDVVVPQGFNLVPAQSYSFENYGIRVGMLKYTGKAKSEQIVNFFKDSMPEGGWNLINILEYEQKMLNFDKEDETCVIVITPKTLVTEVTISLGPKSRSYPKKIRDKEAVIIK